MAEDIGARFAAAALAQRGASYRWLRENYAKIADVFETQARPSWTALAKTATESGIECTPDTLRKAWPLVQRDLARVRKPKVERAQKKPPTTRHRRPPEPVTGTSNEPEGALPLKHTWTPTKLR